MKVKENIILYDDGRVALEIFIDDVKKFSVCDDEPEDSNLSRSFNDCYNVTNLMQLAYLAGKNGEDFVLTTEEIEKNS